MGQYRRGLAMNVLIEDCDYAMLDSKNWCKKIVSDIAKKINMQMLISPVAAELTESRAKCIDDTGISAFVLVAESHIALHTWPRARAIRLAIDSCREFDVSKLDRYLREYFGSNKLTYYGKDGVCKQEVA